ncbi:cobalamin synthase [Sorangium cellulosum]|uniref:Adenosylcobinamide-GDP ribazoletransferase n=1 Tax=Sorangium cellulosum TaxID=56 RepID=A0A4P2Q8P4_SORCE|nr:adenosylcobinamide-GDP ribazoletransferase [Sorangium cellulosum]AUX25558.1 cobalamin synthase [Sorangium cellulosum]
MRAPPILRGARAATTFLTRVPVGGFPYAEADWRWAAAWLPFVGAGLGAIQGAAWLLLDRGGALVAATVTVALSLLLTGAFHEDGLADTADALGGAFDRARMLDILKDSRIGSFGAAALIVVLVMRIALLARLDAAAPVALVLTQCLSRTPPLWLMVALPYVTQHAASRSKPVAQAGLPQALFGSVWPALALAVAHGAGAVSTAEAAAMLGATAVASTICGLRFRARAGGITGDFLGATQQIADCAALLALALARGG